MFAGNVYGRLNVSPQGTLHIQGVLREDSGYFVCSALSVAGSDTARAFLQVNSMYGDSGKVKVLQEKHVGISSLNQKTSYSCNRTMCDFVVNIKESLKNIASTINFLYSKHWFLLNNTR